MTLLRHTRFHLAGFAVSLVLSLASPATAADSPLNRLMSAPAVNLLTAVQPRLVSQLASNAPFTPPNPPPSRFRPSGGRLILAQVVHAMSGGDAGAEKIYRESVEEAFTAYEQQAAAGGLANDIAGALALFVASAELGMNGSEMTDAQSEIIARQLQAGLDTPEMRRAPDRVKQELYEFFGTFGLYLLITRQAAIAGHNDNALAQLKPLSSQALGWVLSVSGDSIVVNDTGLHLPAGSAVPVATRSATVTSASAPVQPSAPAAPANASVLYGIWHGMTDGSDYWQTANGLGHVTTYGIASGLRIKSLTFFSNGWATCYMPPGGLTANADCAALAAGTPSVWGHYTFDGQKGVITFLQGSPLPFDYADGKINYDRVVYNSRRDFFP